MTSKYKILESLGYSGAIIHSHLFAHLLLGAIFFVMGTFWLLTGYLPSHDVIEVHGLSHYFYSSIARGVIPYWNPYSQTGTPFFTYFQAGGFLTPLQGVCILMQILTGCTTLTTYALHYLLMYYLFILGTYYTLRLITSHNGISLLFSLVLWLASFPALMRQNIQPFFLIPFITYFLLLFFRETRAHYKGWYLLLSSFGVALTLLRWIPMFLLLYLGLFLSFAVLLKIADVKGTLRFLLSKIGLFWLSASLGVIVLVSAPLLALDYELRHDTETFPTIRFLQKNGRNLVKLYASDIIKENPLSAKFTGNIKVSTTLGNFLGLLFEPFQFLFGLAENSEIALYVGLLPLLSVALALMKPRSPQVYLFFAIAGVMLLLACNFQIQIFTPPGLAQQVLITLLPFLGMSDVLQNAGILFLFSLMVPAALGLQTLLAEQRKWPWILPVLFPVYKYTVFLPFAFGSLWFTVQTMLLGSGLLLLALLLVTPAGHALAAKLRAIPVNTLASLAVAMLLLDLLSFVVFHVIYRNQVLNPKYAAYLSQENLAQTQREREFLNYRVPFSPMAPRQQFDTFFDHEIYRVEKAAFPVAVKIIRARLTGEPYLANWDHWYMNTSYYDYLVNVNYEKQAVLSHITTPILNFFPPANAIPVDSKYDVAAQLNARRVEELRQYIFIERDPSLTPSPHRGGKGRGEGEVHTDVRQLFNPANYVRYTQADLDNFDRQLGVRYPANPDVTFNILAYDSNRLALTVATPAAGYVYFGDGYSKHWRAWVDAKPTPIAKTNLNFKAVYVPPGTHRVEFVFDPRLFRYALYLWLAGNVGFFTIMSIFLMNTSCYAPHPLSPPLRRGEGEAGTGTSSPLSLSERGQGVRSLRNISE